MTTKIKVLLAAAIAALVGAWFRGRAGRLSEDPVPGTAAWPPLHPLVLAPDSGPVDPGAPAAEWVAPDGDGACPLSHPIKAKASSGIYHQPEGFAYERTRADRCYPTPAAAEADGFRAAKR